MSVHNSDNKELEVVDVNNPEVGPSIVCKPNDDNIITSKSKYPKKRKVDETDFSVITILELLECLSLIILKPAYFWRTLIDILKKQKTEFNLKKILNKLHQNLKAFGMQKSDIMEHYFRYDEKSTLVHDIIRCADGIEARRFVRSIYRRAHHRNQTGTVCIGQHTEISHVHIVHSCTWTGRSRRCAFIRNLPIVHRKSYSTKPKADTTFEYFRNLLHYLHSRIGRNIYYILANAKQTELKIMAQKAIRQMAKKDYWRATTKSITFATDLNGN
jgi:hypothetical protein